MPNGNVSYNVTLESVNLATLQMVSRQEFQQTTLSIALSNSDQYYVQYSVNIRAFTIAGHSNPITASCDTEQGGLFL